MKFLNGQKPNVAQDAIISAIVVAILIGVTVVLFDLTDHLKMNEAQNTPSSSAIKKEMAKRPVISKDTVSDEVLANAIKNDVPAANDHKRDFVYHLPEGVVPPLPSLAPRPLTEQVNADIGEMISTAKNSQIIVPPHAFLDEEGNVVEGNVDLKYCEYHDFRDIFLSGIPMHYDSDEAKGMLESAGMVELTASKDGKAVYVNPANKIKVMLASAFKTNDYNLYYYDKKKNKWEYKGKDEVVLTTPKGTPKRGVVKTEGREMSFQYNSVRYNVGMQCVSDMQDQRKFFFSKKKSPTVLDFKFISCKNINPELKELRGTSWRYEGDDAQQIFSQVFLKDNLKTSEAATTMFEGTAAIQLQPDSTYHLALSRNGTVINVPVEPLVKSTGQSKDVKRKWDKYALAVDKRQKAEKAAYDEFMKDTASFYTTFGKTFNGEATVETVALRTFEVSGFGIWNCDKRFVPEQANSVLARFVDEKGNTLLFNTAYMVEKEKNSVYTLTDFTNFRFDPNSKNLCWAVLDGNKIAIISPEEFARHRNAKSGTCTFTAKVSDTALQTHASLQKALNFN